MTDFNITFKDKELLDEFQKLDSDSKMEIYEFFKTFVEDEFGGFPICYICVEEVIPYHLFTDYVLLFQLEYFDAGVTQTVNLKLIGFVKK